MSRHEERAMKRDNEWKSYLPHYRFPPFLRTCFGCSAILIILCGLFVLLVLPFIFRTINSLNEESILDVAVGSSLDLTIYSLEVVSVEDDSRCSGDMVCSPPGSVWVRFRNTLYGSEYRIEFSESGDFSEIVSLPGGYRIRVINVWPKSLSSPDLYKVRFQVFKPPAE
jgi:hypothetical protein